MKWPEALTKGASRFPERPRYLWSCTRYDGATSGICLHKGREHWFKCVYDDQWIDRSGSEPEYLQGRIFALVELTDEDIKHEYFLQKRFSFFLGGPVIMYEEDGSLKRGKLDKGGWSDRLRRRVLNGPWRWKLYNWSVRNKPKRDYSTRKVIGWWGVKGFSFDMCVMDGMHKRGRL
jgi:hypothetical protein